MNRILSLAAALTLSACGGLLAGTAAAQSPHTHQHSFGGAEQWSQVFDDPKRDAWQKPHEVIQALALKPDAVVADIGSGTGYFSVKFAHMTPKGRVYGVDTEPDMVKFLAERAKRDGLKNITAVAGTPDDPRLPEKADLIILVDVYHHVGDRERYSLTSLTLPGVTRSYRGFSMAAEENGLSRLYAGIHFRHAVHDGRRQGRGIGRAVAEALPRAL